LAAQTGKPVPHSVTAVRHWSLGGVTRIAVEVSGEFQYRSDRLQNPDRVYYDILNARPNFDSKRLYTEDLGGPFVKRIRVAETLPGVTRVVLDLNAGGGGRGFGALQPRSLDYRVARRRSAGRTGSAAGDRTAFSSDGYAGATRAG
jgi:hypothetical protein